MHKTAPGFRASLLSAQCLVLDGCVGEVRANNYFTIFWECAKLFALCFLRPSRHLFESRMTHCPDVASAGCTPVPKGGDPIESGGVILSGRVSLRRTSGVEGPRITFAVLSRGPSAANLARLGSRSG